METNEQYQYAYSLKPFEQHSTERSEKLLHNITKPHPDIIWNTFEQVLLAETKQESFMETFYYWVYTILTTDDLETLYTYLEDKYFQYEPPSAEDYEEEWTETPTQQSRRRWLEITE